MPGGDYYQLVQEATQKATKDPISFVEGVALGEVQYPGGRSVPAAGTGAWPAYNNLGAAEHLAVQARFTYGSGGTSAKFYLQSSLDGENTWFDVICFAFTTASARKIAAASLGVEEANPGAIEDGELLDNKARQGVLGDVFRIKYVITGTYVDSTICIAGIAKSF